MLHYFLREVGGWLLVIAGLYLFLVCVAILLNPQPSIIEASYLSVIGIIVFRGGIHLLKVAVAARICLHAQAEVVKQRSVEKPTKKADSPWDW